MDYELRRDLLQRLEMVPKGLLNEMPLLNSRRANVPFQQVSG